MRDARRFTFLYVKGTDAELRRWNDDAGRIDEVPLFYLEDDRVRDSLAPDLMSFERTSIAPSLIPDPASSEDEGDFKDQ
jgi:hypothetical protein